MHDKRIATHLLTHCRALPMTGIHDGVGRQRVDPVFEREDQRRPRSSGEIAATDTTMEERVSGDEIWTDTEAYGPSCMARGMHHFDVEVVPAKHLAVAQIALADDIGLVVGDTREIAHRLELLAIVGVDRSLAIARGLQRRYTTDVVGVPVREQNPVAAQAALFEQRQRLGMLQPWIDDQRIGRVAAPKHVAVLIKGWIDDDGELNEVAQRVSHDNRLPGGGVDRSEDVSAGDREHESRTSAFTSARRIGLDESSVEHLADILDRNHLDRIENLLIHLIQVAEVLGRKDEGLQPGTVRGEQLVLDATDGKH